MPTDLGFLPRDPGTLDLGPVSSISVVLIRAGRCQGLDLRCRLLYPPPSSLVLPPLCLTLEHGVVGCGLSDAMRIWRFTLPLVRQNAQSL